MSSKRNALTGLRVAVFAGARRSRPDSRDRPPSRPSTIFRPSSLPPLSRTVSPPPPAASRSSTPGPRSRPTSPATSRAPRPSASTASGPRPAAFRERSFRGRWSISSPTGSDSPSAVPVVVYSEDSDIEATYVATVLRTAGVKQVSVLDGGFKRWTAEKRAVTAERKPVAASTEAFVPRPADLVALDEVKKAVETKSAVLLDARPARPTTRVTSPARSRASG